MAMPRDAHVVQKLKGNGNVVELTRTMHSVPHHDGQGVGSVLWNLAAHHVGHGVDQDGQGLMRRVGTFVAIRIIFKQKVLNITQRDKIAHQTCR